LLPWVMSRSPRHRLPGLRRGVERGCSNPSGRPSDCANRAANAATTAPPRSVPPYTCDCSRRRPGSRCSDRRRRRCRAHRAGATARNARAPRLRLPGRDGVDVAHAPPVAPPVAPPFRPSPLPDRARRRSGRQRGAAAAQHVRDGRREVAVDAAAGAVGAAVVAGRGRDRDAQRGGVGHGVVIAERAWSGPVVLACPQLMLIRSASGWRAPRADRVDEAGVAVGREVHDDGRLRGDGPGTSMSSSTSPVGAGGILPGLVARASTPTAVTCGLGMPSRGSTCPGRTDRTRHPAR